MLKKGITFLSLCLAVSALFAQEAPVEMADDLRASGKIYVVVGVLLIIFAGIVFYLIRLDRKISALEKGK